MDVVSKTPLGDAIASVYSRLGSATYRTDANTSSRIESVLNSSSIADSLFSTGASVSYDSVSSSDVHEVERVV